MHLAVEADFFENILAISFEATVEVMQGKSRKIAQYPIEDFRWPAFMPRVESALFPTADHVIAFVKLGEHSWDLFRIVLKIRIHRDDDFAGRLPKPSG